MNIPKLPQQDNFLLDLQNNNYSLQTVFNYARDLSIFATYIFFQKVDFNKINKEIITNYKGYLRSGDHIQDLYEIRRIYNEKHDRSNAPKTNENEKDDSILVEKSRKPQDNNKFIFEIYKKVFGSLGSELKRYRLENGKYEYVYGRKSSGESGGLDARSINRMLSSIRSYLKYRIDFDLEIPLAPDAIKLIKAERKKSQVADLDELIKLIEAPTQFEKIHSISVRNRCMLEILFSTGMRISELMSLDLEDINSDGKLFITGKGKKQRFVYLTKRSLNWLNEYLKTRIELGLNYDNKFKKSYKKEKEYIQDLREKGLSVKQVSQESDSINKLNLINSSLSDEEHKYIKILEELRANGLIKKFNSPALFIPIGSFAGHRSGERYSTNAFQEKIAEYRRRLGIIVPTSAHSLRHGFATYLAENGANPTAIQILLGHESLNTTTRYVHASDKFAQETHKDKHPLK